MLHHGLSLGPQLPDCSEDVTTSFSLDLLNQDGQTDVETAAVRAVPENE